MVASNDILNPFFHHPELKTTYDKIRTGFFTVVVLPIRILIITALLVLAWCLACIGLYGLTEDDLTKRPISGWRRVIRKWICILGRYAYYAGGMHITVKGNQVSRAEASILVIAPHSTFLDAAIVYVTGFPSIIVRRESGMNPWLGKLINFTQPVYVGREDRDSRQKTIQNIIDRTTSQLDWPQVLIFPEGTCTNRSCLITFKPGAFYPGVPVQPVLIRYPNKLDTVTWTWDGPGVLTLLWLTLTRAHSYCEIEFLPVYTPNDEEKKDPKLYAHNVRTLMANALGIPTSDYSFEDIHLLKKARDLELPQSALLIRTHKLRSSLGFNGRKTDHDQTETNLEILRTKAEPKFISKSDFASLLTANEADHKFDELFHMFSEEINGTEMLNLHNYLLAVYLINKATSKKNVIRLSFDCYDNHLNLDKFQYVIRLVYSVSREQAGQIFNEIVSKDQVTITYDEFIKYFRMFPNAFSENNNSDDCKPHGKKDI